MASDLADLRSLRPRRVCLIKPSSLGDVVHALPVLAALRERWPDAQFAWVINTGLRGLVEHHPLLDEVIPFERTRAGSNPAELARFLFDLRRRQFDLAIDLQGLFRSGLMARATGAPVRVGLAAAREGAGWFYTHRVAPRPDRPHAVDVLRAVAETFGGDDAPARFVLAMTDADRQWAREALTTVPRPRLILNLGARWLTKRWPVERFAQVARRAAEHLGAGLAVVGGGEDRPLVQELTARLAPIPVRDLAGRTSLPQLAAVAATAELFLSNDTGPLHLAAAAGARVVGIYTCTRPEWTGPYGPKAVAVQTRVACAGRCRKRCPHMDCMAELDAERVWRVVRDGLEAEIAVKPTAA